MLGWVCKGFWEISAVQLTVSVDEYVRQALKLIEAEFKYVKTYSRVICSEN